MALAVGLTDNCYYTAHIEPAANFVPATGRRSARALGGAGRLLAVDHVGGDRRPGRGGDHRRPQRRPRVGARVARHGRRVPAQPEGVDADDERTAARRRTSSGCRRRATRTPRSSTASAMAARRSTSATSSTPASWSSRGSGLLRPTTPTSSTRSRWSTRRSGRHGQRRRLPPVQRRRLRRSRSDGSRGRRPAGHRAPVAGAGRRARTVRARHRRHRRGAVAAPATRCAIWLGVGLIPEQAWEQPDLPASPFGTDPTRPRSASTTASRPARRALTWSAGQFVRLSSMPPPGRSLDRPVHGRPLRAPRAGRRRR